MASLKSFIDTFADYLGTTPALLYERQRALVRAEILLPERPGKGPGHGVIATPTTVALLLIAALSGADLSTAAQRTAQLMAITRGKRRLTDTLAELLSSPDALSKVKGIRISQSAVWAQIQYTLGSRSTHSVTYKDAEWSNPAVRLIAEVDVSALRQFSNWLAAEED